MDDKQKTIAVVALAVVVVGIGAFQFLGGGGHTPQKKTKGSKDQAADAKTLAAKGGSKDAFVLRNPLVANQLPPRDPFEAGKITNILPNATTGPNAKGQRNIRVPGGVSIPPLDPGRLQGSIPDGKGPLPPGISMPKPDVFSMSLAAVIMGDRPAAVFQDEQGNQRLVTLGGRIDGDSVVTRISRGTVTVSYKGKTVTLTVGAVKTNGNP